jgi:Fe-S cluster biogenesis protein NfuA
MRGRGGILNIHHQYMTEIETKITTILEKVRPYIQTHGGDVRLTSVTIPTVTLTIDGACTHCPLAELTYNKVIRTLILEDVPEITSVMKSKKQAN